MCGCIGVGAPCDDTPRVAKSVFEILPQEFEFCITCYLRRLHDLESIMLCSLTQNELGQVLNSYPCRRSKKKIYIVTLVFTRSRLVQKWRNLCLMIHEEQSCSLQVDSQIDIL